jgi:rhodanese-related sulfurtransferase
MTSTRSRTNPSEISVQELKSRLDRNDDITILDVRERFEHNLCNIGGVLIPLGELPARFGELDREREIAILCHHGVRSTRAAEFLVSCGFAKVKNITGGIDAWSRSVDPAVKRY